MHQHGERAAVAVGDRTHFIRTGNWASAVLRWSLSQRSLPRTDLVSYKDDSGDLMASSILLPFAGIHSFIHLFIWQHFMVPSLGKVLLVSPEQFHWPTFSGRISQQLSRDILNNKVRSYCIAQGTIFNNLPCDKSWRCPTEWNYPGMNTRVDSHSFLQGIFPTQR